VIAAIPYTTFPEINVGPLTLRVFGLMVAAGVLVGARLGGSYGERFGVLREDSYRTGTLMVLAGIIGSRLTWVATHTDQVKNPVDVIAIWQGGIQFSGGFIAALAVGYPMFRKWTKAQRWNVLNGYAWGLTAGIALGRVGCYSVGEHFGRQSDFFLATRYDGGKVREPTLGDVQLVKGMTFHNTSLYEMITLGALFVVMTGMILWARRKGTEVKPGTLVALFMVYGGIERFLLDTLRVNDERLLHMTGAQWMSLVMVPYGIWVWLKVRPEVSKLVGPNGLPLDLPVPEDGSLLASTEDDSSDGEEPEAPDELEAPEDSDEDAEVGAEESEDAEEPEPAEAEADVEDEQPEDEEAEPVAAEVEAEEADIEGSEASEDTVDGTDEDEKDAEPEPVESGSEPA